MPKKNSREARIRVMVAAEMIDGESRIPVTILNISRRGLLASCSKPPSRGHYVEIRNARTALVGRVAWSGKQAFGVRSQDDIDIEKLTGIRSSSQENKKTSGKKTLVRLHKGETAGSISSEEARIRASRSTFVAGIIMACIGAAVVVGLVYETFSNPIDGIREVISRRN